MIVVSITAALYVVFNRKPKSLKEPEWDWVDSQDPEFLKLDAKGEEVDEISDENPTE